ncbi:MAG: UPF0175 family protein [Candidatus Nanohaloarchaea archaeon]|nr:UPF0175 family protein [Candidatus Nanohaloarchaea archaeon]
MAEVDLTIPRDVFDSVKLPSKEKEERMRVELAVALYREGALSFGKARELAGMSAEAFHQELGKREVERHYTEEELAEDADYAAG